MAPPLPASKLGEDGRVAARNQFNALSLNLDRAIDRHRFKQHHLFHDAISFAAAAACSRNKGMLFMKIEKKVHWVEDEQHPTTSSLFILAAWVGGCHLPKF
jgi:hypothetical protein